MLKLCHIQTEGNTLMIYREKQHDVRAIYQWSLFDRLDHKHNKTYDRQKEILWLEQLQIISYYTYSAREEMEMLAVLTIQSWCALTGFSW